MYMYMYMLVALGLFKFDVVSQPARSQRLNPQSEML